MYHSLPTDIQREIYNFLTDYWDRKKLYPKFLNNPNDYYWKVKVATLVSENFCFRRRNTISESISKGITYRDFYEILLCEKIYDGWYGELIQKMIDDEWLLTKHINLQDRNKRTALMYATYSSEEHVKILLDAGADVNIQDCLGDTALMDNARDFGRANVVPLLNAGANVNLQNNNGKTALILEACNTNGESIKYLLAAGANINHRDCWGQTALIHGTRSLNIENYKLLIDAGADVNLQTIGGWTPLFEAIVNSRTENVKLLLAAGADINRQTSDKKTALMLAMDKHNEEIIQLLLAAGAEKI